MEMKEIVIVGVYGKAGCGKDTLSDHLVEKYNYHKLSFAKKLKQHCVDEHDWDGKKDDKGRRLLQFQGTEVHRITMNMIWVDFLRLEIALLVGDGYDKFVISDMRFLNEFDFIVSAHEQEFGKGVNAVGCPIKITGRAYEMTEDAMKHQSENDLAGVADSSFSHVILNFGTKDKFYEDIEDIITRYGLDQ